MRLAFALTLVVALLVAGGASAQTGGSFGSSDFGSSGGGSSSSGGGSSYESSSSSSGSGGGAPARPDSAATFSVPGAELGSPWITEPEVPDAERAVTGRGIDRVLGAWCAATPLMLLGLVALSWVTGRTPAERRARAIAEAEGPCEVRRVSIGFDWSVRRELQAALDRMASASSIEGSEGRRRAAREVTRHLHAALSGARFACFQSYRVGKAECEARFQRLATDLRARFTRETAGARSHGEAPAMRARADEGEGLVVVSLVVATDRWLGALPRAMDRAAIASALMSSGNIEAPTVFALEVVWSPSVEEDRLSSLELEASYPELQLLDGVPRLGRVSCDYCRAPYPAELPRCPGCGGPRA